MRAQCDYCQRPTPNGRDEAGERLCHQCRHAEARQQYRPTALDAALKTALERLPETFHERLLKAHDLALSGHVAKNGAGYIVRSQTEAGKTYHVNGAGCNCPDAAHRAPTVAGRPACKHQIAVWLKKKMHEKIEPQTLQTSEAHVRSQSEATNEYKSTRKHGAVKPGTLNGKDYIAWCKRCQAETNFGFGLGCLDCIERYEQRKREQREAAEVYND